MIKFPTVKRFVHKGLRLVGKNNQKVIAVFGVSPETAHAAVVHVRKGEPDVPVWLYCPAPPLPETSVLCERVEVGTNGLPLLLLAQAQLWPRWVSLSVGTWTGEPGNRAFKLAPLVIPPFRSLFLNGNGDFFPGTAAYLLRHSVAPFRQAAHVCADTIRNTAVRIKDIVCAKAVQFLGHTLNACANPHRTFFPKLHGTEALELPAVPAAGSREFVRYRQHGPAWRAEAIAKLARSSNARWILWHEGNEPEVTDTMLEPFADECTFAVSIQSHYRAWKPMLVPTAPFRAIQPGAATQVLAPLSSGILVDREKLLALSIPGAGLSGTAWLILFWKAAAAGWRCYSTGQAAEIGEQPDFPAVETAFLIRLLFRPELRRLAPREPDLSRGTITFTPRLCRAARRGSGKRVRALIVSPFLPYPLSHGGAVRIYNICRALSGRVDFALAAIREKHDIVNYTKLHEVFEKVYVVDVDEFPSRDENLPKQVRQHQSRSLRALIARFAEEWEPDLVQIEYTHMAAFGDSAPGIPSVLVEHDLTFSLYRQLAEKQDTPEAWREFERWRTFERSWFRRYDAVWTVSHEDREIAIREGSSPHSTFAIPNGVDTSRFLPADENTPAPEIFFVGSFRHLPNLLAFEKLRDIVMPLIWRHCPGAHLRVVAGPRHEEFWRGRQALDRRITVHGFVEDLRPLYAKASAVVAPLEVSAGTNIKVLEAMACGKAVISTPVGCAGLGLAHGHNALIYDVWADFAAGVCRVLSEPDLRRRLSVNARRTAERNFSWDAIAGRAYDSYCSVARAFYSERAIG